jgi:hypothetical protein
LLVEHQGLHLVLEARQGVALAVISNILLYQYLRAFLIILPLVAEEPDLVLKHQVFHQTMVQTAVLERY